MVTDQTIANVRASFWYLSLAELHDRFVKDGGLSEEDFLLAQAAELLEKHLKMLRKEFP